MMYIQIDLDSEEALYIQLTKQIIYGIATKQVVEGEALPSVRQLANQIGINMHTVNKAYDCLRSEGLVRMDRRRGAVVSVDVDKMSAMEELNDELKQIVAKAVCKGVTREETHHLVDQIYDSYVHATGQN